MGYAALQSPMTAADFLAWDATQTIKHEFVRGEVFAMAGASEAHVSVTLNVAMALKQHLRGTPCRTFMSDMKLRVEVVDAYFYPDVLVTCSAFDVSDPLAKREPTLLVEVLSPGTAAYDRGEKFATYRQLPSLQEVVLIDPATRRCDVFRKGVGTDATVAHLWVLHPFEADQGVQLASVGLDLPADLLWEEVPLVAPPSAPAESSAPTA